MTQLAPLTKVTSLATARAFCEKWVFPYGPPEVLLSDQGAQFTSRFFQHVCNILEIRQTMMSAYHPQTNGQTERFNRTLLSAIRAFCTDSGTDWDQYTSQIAYGYNCTVHRATGLTRTSWYWRHRRLTSRFRRQSLRMLRTFHLNRRRNCSLSGSTP